MSKPIIGITGNEREIPDDHFIHMSYTATGFVEGVKEVGGIPMILPIGDEEMAKQYVSIVDKLIITGGQNVCPQFYGEEKTIDSDDYNIVRDEFELALLKEALRQNKPVMAICRGLQLVNVAFGGTLNQHIENHWQGLPFGTSHSIRTEKDSVVERLFGQASQINSVHRQSIKDLAPNFRATAFDPRDNTIEAIESVDNHRIIGLQWHPEFLINEEKGNLELFQYLLQEL